MHCPLARSRTALRDRHAPGRRFTLLVAVALSAPTALPALGQAPAVGALGPGSRVRVHASADDPGVRGIVLSVEPEHLTIAAEAGAPLRFRTESLQRIEASAGWRTFGLRGALIGAGILGLGGAFDPVDPADCGDDSPRWCSRGEAIVYGALGGALLGWFIGRGIQREVWVPIDVRRTPTADGGARIDAGVELRM